MTGVCRRSETPGCVVGLCMYAGWGAAPAPAGVEAGGPREARSTLLRPRASRAARLRRRQRVGAGAGRRRVGRPERRPARRRGACARAEGGRDHALVDRGEGGLVLAGPAAGGEDLGTHARGGARRAARARGPERGAGHTRAHRGVEVAEIGRAQKAAATDDDVVGPVVRTPIGPIVERCNEASQNLYAESLLKRTVHARTGRAGSWDEADEVIRLVARERLGDSAASLVESLHIDDGSGLSHDNRLTAGFLTAWLDSFDDEPALRHLFVESLSRGGDRDDGTLGKRFRDLPENCRVDGKSGYISGVSTLSGFVTGPDGRRWSFSVLCNGVAHDIRGAKTLQERIVREIALHGLSS